MSATAEHTARLHRITQAAAAREAGGWYAVDPATGATDGEVYDDEHDAHDAADPIGWEVLTGHEYDELAG